MYLSDKHFLIYLKCCRKKIHISNIKNTTKQTCNAFSCLSTLWLIIKVLGLYSLIFLYENEYQAIQEHKKSKVKQNGISMKIDYFLYNHYAFIIHIFPQTNQWIAICITYTCNGYQVNRCCGFYFVVAKTKLVFDTINGSRMCGYIKLMLNDIFLFEWINHFMFYIQLLFSLRK